MNGSITCRLRHTCANNIEQIVSALSAWPYKLHCVKSSPDAVRDKKDVALRPLTPIFFCEKHFC